MTTSSSASGPIGTNANVLDDPEMMTAATTGAGLTSSTPLATSQEIRDRGSAFVGYVYRARTTEEAKEVVGWHREHDRDRERRRYRHVGEKAHAYAGAKDTGTGKDTGDRDGDVYTIVAWRCMVVKSGRTGLGGPDEFEVEGGSDDGGEQYAGKRVLGVMQREGVIDAVVIVSRWFGGTLLGPVRFNHMETCATEVCRRFKKIEEMEECIQTLNRLDGVLATLRAQLTTTLEHADPGSSRVLFDDSRAKNKAPDYRVVQQVLDLTKAKRLIHARECAIQNTKTLIEKYKTST